jgi:hypothetical protein
MRIHESGYITDPDFHDGYLTGIRVRDNHLLELYLTHVDQKRYVLRIPGLRYLKASEFWAGNIIFELSTLSGEKLPQDEIRTLCGFDNPYVENNDDRFSEFYKRAVGENWTLIELSSSMGCELQALSTAPFEQFVLGAEE